MIIVLNLNWLTEEQARAQLRDYNFNLPKYFDFKLDMSITFCTEQKKVIEVKKYLL